MKRRLSIKYRIRLASALYRYDMGKVYDKIEPAATRLINSPTDVRGLVNLHPRIARPEA